MRSPRVVYGVVAVVLAVAGFVLPRYLDRSAPELGETVVIPAGAPGTPTTTPTSPPEPGAGLVPPASPRTAGQDDPDDDADDLDDDD
ncbi:hypothetical protein [Kribbella catacumbae]|uniref:hypothetical protein n=1 Tax=Kribbella catacumbae TaxID=460086 RepID=UPI00058C7F58|nr:hypothetical protein [Kribbella catacumbae]